MQAAVVQQDAGFRIRTPESRVQAVLFVFYAGDMLGALVKARNPAWAAGGVLRPDYQTLSHSSGYIRRCEITPLMQTMIGEMQGMVHPEQREHKETQYTIEEDGKEPRLIGIAEQDEERSQLLYTPFYPTYEAGRLCGQTDGIVLMPVRTFVERDAMQRFLFPNWDELKKTNAFPTRLKTLEKYFMNRKAEATSELEDQVADAAIRSCTDLNTWATQTIADENAKWEEAKTKGWAWPYGTNAIAAFEMTGISRLDQQAVDQGNKLDALIDVTRQNAEMMGKIAVGGGQGPVAGGQAGLTDAERAELEQLRAFRAEQLEKQRAAASVDGVDKVDVVDGGGQQVVLDEVQCTAKTREGNQCKNKAEADGLCRTHSG